MPFAQRLILSILACTLSACAHTRAMAPGPIVTDRPDQTEGTDLVSPGWSQVEGGITAFSPRRGPDSRQAGEVLLRYGVASRFEARAELPSVMTSRNRRREFTDGSLGFKTPLLVPRSDASRAVPALSLLAAMGVSTQWGNGVALRTPEVILAAGWGLTDRWDVSANIVTDPFSRYASNHFVGTTLATGYEFNDRLGSYAEIYALDVPAVNGGLTYRLTPDFQVDARIGRTASTLFTGVGLGVRW
jgi:hypothetical protein